VDRKQHLYLWLTGFFVTALVVGDIIAVRFTRVAGFDLSAGMLFFPLTFVLTDVVNEFYGPVGAKRITFVGLGMAGFTFLMINVVLKLPPGRFGAPADAVTTVLSSSRRLYIASLSAYLLGQLSDITIFGIFRRRTGHRMIWLRATGSTLISQAIDTLVVNFVLLAGNQSVHEILLVVRNSYVVKIGFAVGLTPLIYAAHGLVSRILKINETPVKA
jgi:queuosine precursor transporter